MLTHVMAKNLRSQMLTHLASSINFILTHQ